MHKARKEKDMIRDEEIQKKKIKENAKGILNVFKRMLNVDKFKILFSSSLDTINTYVYGEKIGYFGACTGCINYSKAGCGYSISMPMPTSFQKPSIDEMRKRGVVNDFYKVMGFKSVDLGDAAKIYGCSEEDVEEALAETLVEYATSWRRLSFGANPSPMHGPLTFEEILIQADLEGDI